MFAALVCTVRDGMFAINSCVCCLFFYSLCNNPITPPDVEAMRLLVEVTQREQGGEIKAKKIILFDNLLKKKPLCGYGGF